MVHEIGFNGNDAALLLMYHRYNTKRKLYCTFWRRVWKC